MIAKGCRLLSAILNATVIEDELIAFEHVQDKGAGEERAASGQS